MSATTLDRDLPEVDWVELLRARAWVERRPGATYWRVHPDERRAVVLHLLALGHSYGTIAARLRLNNTWVREIAAEWERGGPEVAA